LTKLDENLDIIIAVVSKQGGGKGTKIAKELANCDLVSVIV